MIVSTRMACADGIMALETAYFRALEAAILFHLRNDELTIYTISSDGSRYAQLLFQRVMADPDSPVSSTSND